MIRIHVSRPSLPLVAIVLLAACSGPDQATVEPLPTLAPLPTPDLSHLDALAKQRIQESVDSLELARSTGASRAVLGHGWGELGRRYHAHEIVDGARNCYENAEALTPGDYRWPYYLGRLLAAHGEGQEAIDALERARKLRPDDAPTLLSICQTRRERGELDEAEKLALEAISLQPTDALAYQMVGQIAADRQDFAASARAYERVLELQPSADRMHRPLAMAYRALGDRARAEEHLALAGDGPLTVADPLMAELAALAAGADYWQELGMAAFERGDFASAVEQFRKAVAARPGDARLTANLGSALTRAGDLKGALEAYREALRIDPKYPDAHFNLGVVRAKLGDEDGAVESYRAAIALAPEYRNARFNLANALRRAGECAEATEHYAQIVSRAPNDAPARLGEVICTLEAGRLADAKVKLEAGLRALPDDPLLGNALARLLASCPEATLRDGTRALDIADKLVATARSPENLEVRAMALAEVGRYADAVAAQAEALRSAEGAGRYETVPRLRENLELYRAGKPCRAPAIG